MSTFRIVFLLVLITVVVVLEWYVMRGLRSTFRSGTPLRIALWAEWISIGIVAVSLVGLALTFAGVITRSTAFNNLFTGLTITFFFAKLVFAGFLFGEDLVRGVVWGVRKVISGPGSDSGPVEMASRRKFIGQMGLVVAAIPFSGFLYGMLKGKYDFRVHRQRLAFPDLPPAFEGFRIVQLSDIHSGSFAGPYGLEKGIRLAMEQEPDLVLFTGDLVNNLAVEVEPYLEIIGQLKGKYGQYSVLGNHDYGDYMAWESREAKAANQSRLEQLQAQMGFTLLKNESVVIEKDGQRIRLAGVENWGKPPFPQHGDLDRAMAGAEPGDFTILMSHDPTHWDLKVLPSTHKVHLTLSGHTHGAQMGVEIPGFRFSPVQWRYHRWAGLYEEGEEKLYVNRGFGFLGYPGRIGIWPEVTVIELGKAV
jgi:predicted MPP superfamily phosphohydrolase